MRWNWQLPNWPKFNYAEGKIIEKERLFLLNIGQASASLKNIIEEDHKSFIIEILSEEAFESSKIEGEILDRESLQSSIKKHFGLKSEIKKIRHKETGMAESLCDVYESFEQPLTHEMLWKWHAALFKNDSDIESCGQYRTHTEPMQIVSRRYDSQKVFFEAPPSELILEEMTRFIHWFNKSPIEEPILGRAAIAHVYFESIHPFEDGNGRIGRILIEKLLSRAVKKPTLFAVSKILEKEKKNYYAALETCNKALNADDVVCFLADAILKAQENAMTLLHFLIFKSKILHKLADKLNDRQEKVLLKMFSMGPNGFDGGLSAENYLTITKTSRATATRDLVDLVSMGALVKTGELRHTRYWLNFKE